MHDAKQTGVQSSDYNYLLNSACIYSSYHIVVILKVVMEQNALSYWPIYFVCNLFGMPNIKNNNNNNNKTKNKNKTVF